MEELTYEEWRAKHREAIGRATGGNAHLAEAVLDCIADAARLVALPELDETDETDETETDETDETETNNP